MLVRNFAFSNHFNSPLNRIAKNAEDIAPIRIKFTFLRSIPSKIKVPSPPAPTSAARVAVPIIKTVAVRIPDTITGIARGNSNFLRRSNLLIPNAIPASSRLGSIPFSAVIVFSRIGKIA